MLLIKLLICICELMPCLRHASGFVHLEAKSGQLVHQCYGRLLCLPSARLIAVWPIHGPTSQTRPSLSTHPSHQKYQLQLTQAAFSLHVSSRTLTPIIGGLQNSSDVFPIICLISFPNFLLACCKPAQSSVMTSRYYR